MFSETVAAMFKDVKTEGSVLNKLWKENSVVMEEAYAQAHRTRSRSYKKLGLFRARYTDEQYINSLLSTLD